MKNKNEIDFTKFVDYVHTVSSTELSTNEVKEILTLEEDYNKDSTASLGISLRLNELYFEGEKQDGSSFNYSQRFYSGIHVWLADNLKGKSSIFKIIKYAITGNNKLKPDVGKWIKKIVLEFQIGEQVYTCYINKKGRAKGALYEFSISTFKDLEKSQKLDTILEKKIFDFNSDSTFEPQMQEFFFNHFDFYNLKYTSKSGGKGDTTLKVIHLSWSTYFNSIYLESKNYSFLYFDKEQFGTQGRKIFEMILGLPLTYPINMLTIQKDKTEETIGKLEMVDSSVSEKAKKTYNTLIQRQKYVETELENLKKDTKLEFDDSALIEEYNSLFKKLSVLRNNKIGNSKELDKLKWSIRSTSREIENLIEGKDKLYRNLNSIIKKSNDLELYQKAGSFFSNLDIKSCPHCDNLVSDEEIEKENSEHTCRLCGNDSTDQKIAEEEITSKLEMLKDERNETESRYNKIKSTISFKEIELENLNQSVSNIEIEGNELTEEKLLESQLVTIESKLKTSANAKNQASLALKKREALMKEEAVLSYRLKEIETGKVAENQVEIETLKKKLEILKIALKALGEKRIKFNVDIIKHLENLMLSELHAFGLSSVTKVKIDNKYNPIFTQNETDVSFSDLSEGEMLRAKLCFYLSLIQLDIEHNLGKHPRFLIFDSPGKEEIVTKDLVGLADILKEVNKRLGSKLQIFVGSALREFATITEWEYFINCVNI